MKTTIELPDDLIERSREIQKRDGTTLKALVEEGLRLAIQKRAKPADFRFEPVFGGHGWLTDEAERAGGLGALLQEINQR
jgi:hypothetical protein